MLHLLTVLFVLISPAGPIREGSTKGSPSTDSIQKLQLQTVDVLAEKKTSTPDLQRLNALRRFEHSGTPLARQLEAVPGMSVLSSGTQLAKPVINGLHSQRILILQDGVRLEGQQWGSDHAPEIDPFQEGEWSILQAAASLRHGPEAIGGVLDLQAPPLLQHGHLDAHASTVWMSNNGLIGTHLRLQGPASRNGRLQWRWQGSSRMSGNLRLPGA
jgi:iron complex outermembrane receptor protein